MQSNQSGEHRSLVSQINGERFSEFVYGMVTSMVAVAGLSAGHDITPSSAVEIVFSGAVAIWLAHAYARLISMRIEAKRSISLGDLLDVLEESWPIIVAGLLLSIPFFLSGLGIWTFETALSISSFAGIAILTLVGLLAGAAAQEPWRRRIRTAAIAACLGLFAVGVEFAVHH